MKTCLYLRKSREDIERERLGEADTLQRHRNMLLEYAKKHGLNIVEIYEEVVSGESIIHRPKMIQLLKDVEAKLYDAVLCVDIQRLGRGNLQDQGLILETFKNASTKLITLNKTYDLQNEHDEEYSEFEAFMARKEYKMINKRLQRGRQYSVREGNYICTYPPYGYIKDGLTLIEHPEQADVVRTIFDMYCNKNLGGQTIANELNNLGVKTYWDKKWSHSMIKIILENPVYVGKIRWRRKKIIKSTNPLRKKESKIRPAEEWIVADGKHQAIIDEVTFRRATEIRTSRLRIPTRVNCPPVNPLAGLIICGNCGEKMHKKLYKGQVYHLVCRSKCGTRSTRFDHVEAELIASLGKWLENYTHERKVKELKKAETSIYAKALKSLEEELNNLSLQRNNLHDLLERGVYDIDTFIARSNHIAERVTETNKNIELAKQKLEESQKNIDFKTFTKKMVTILEAYHLSNDVTQKNLLLKSILEKAIYTKTKQQRNNNFELRIYPKIYVP